MSRYECIDFKVVLSAYVDGELAGTGRADADRHLLACRQCRDLLENAERNDDAIRSLCARDAAFAERVGAALPLPSEFESAVFNRVHRRRRMNWRRVYDSFGLLSAAAAIALACALFFVLRAGRDRASGEVNEHISEGNAGTPRAVVTLTEEESQALRTSATTLWGIIQTPFQAVQAREDLRQIVLYDDLPRRLSELRTKLDTYARRDVDAALATFLELNRQPNVEMWSDLVDDLKVLDLVNRLESIANESESRDAA